MFLSLLVLSALYVALIGGLVLLLHRLRLPLPWALLWGCLGFGLVSGVLAAWVWPLDSCVYPNVCGVLLGDWLYQLAAAKLGDPWLLRVPQVYILASATLFGLLGSALCGLTVRRRRAP